MEKPLSQRTLQIATFVYFTHSMRCECAEYYLLRNRKFFSFFFVTFFTSIKTDFSHNWSDVFPCGTDNACFKETSKLHSTNPRSLHLHHRKTYNKYWFAVRATKKNNNNLCLRIPRNDFLFRWNWFFFFFYFSFGQQDEVTVNVCFTLWQECHFFFLYSWMKFWNRSVIQLSIIFES